MQPERETTTSNFTSTESDSLELSADSLQLADQLRAEAILLAERYPAPNGAAGVGHARQHRSWRVIAGGVLSGGVALAIAMAVMLRGDNRTAPAPPERAQASVTNRSAESSNDSVSTVAAEDSESIDLPSLSTGDHAAGILRNVSGPELEGLLDLMETEDDSQTSISI